MSIPKLLLTLLLALCPVVGRADYKPEFKLSVNVREDSDASETQMPRLEVAGSYPIAARRN